MANTLKAAIVAELRKSARQPSFIVPTIVFPIIFFGMFGLPNASHSAGHGVSFGAYMMASYGAYAVMTTALISFAVSIATERALGWNRLLRVTPLTPGVYFTAKVVNALAIGAASLIALFTFGIITAHVSMPLVTWVELFVLLLLGMLPFVLLGFAIGYAASPSAAAPIANLINLPLAFGSGLFMPLPFLPESIQTIAPYLPSYHVAQLGWSLLGVGDPLGLPKHLLSLAGYGVMFALMALRAYKKDEGRTFG